MQGCDAADTHGAGPEVHHIRLEAGYNTVSLQLEQQLARSDPGQLDSMTAAEHRHALAADSNGPFGSSMPAMTQHYQAERRTYLTGCQRRVAPAQQHHCSRPQHAATELGM